MNKCFKCGAEFEGNFCPQCGAKFEMRKTCPQCHTQLDGQAKFCNNCGYNFVEEKPATQSKQKKQVGKAVKNFAQKSKAWLVAHKAIAIIVATVIFVGIVLAIVLPLTVGNIFRANKVAKINVGDDAATVEKILGTPYEVENNNVYYYYSKNITKKMDEMKKLDEQIDSITSFSELEKLAEKEEKLEAEMAAMVFSRITVKFVNDKVNSVEMDTKAKMDNTVKEIKWQADGNKKQKIEFVPELIPYGLSPDVTDIVAKIYYADGSYRMNAIYPKSEGGNENGWTLTWSDNWGEYSWQIKESTEKSNVVVQRGHYLILEMDNGDYVLSIENNIDYGDASNIREYADKITVVYVTPNVTSIYSEVFKNLTRVELEEYEGGVYLGSASNPYQSLWNLATTDVTSFTIHPDTQTIMNGVFKNCTKLTQINLPDNVSIIGSEAFYGCSSLVSLSLPNNVSRIGDGAFSNCSSLVNLSIPDSVTTLGTGFIANCNKLQYNTYDNANYLGNDSNPYVILVKTTGSDISSCNISENVKFIMPNAFYQHQNLTSITIPNGVTIIEEGTFEGCTSLASVTISNSVTQLGTNAFAGCSGLVSVQLGNGLMEISYYAFSDCSSLTDITIPNSVKSIEDGAFANCSSLKEIVIPNSVGYVGSSCFENCTSLERVTLPEGIHEIWEHTFYGCISLKNVTIPNEVYDIGEEAFSGCISLTSITIPQNLNTIHEGAFSGCTNLTNVIFKETKGWWVFYEDYNDGKKLSANDLANAATAANFLTSTYVNYYWGRE